MATISSDKLSLLQNQHEQKVHKLKETLKKLNDLNSEIINAGVSDFGKTSNESPILQVEKVGTILSGVITNCVDVVGENMFHSKINGVDVDEITQRLEDTIEVISAMKKEKQKQREAMVRTKNEYLGSTLRVTNELLAAIAKNKQEVEDLQKLVSKYRLESKEAKQELRAMEYGSNVEELIAREKEYENIKEENKLLRKNLSELIEEFNVAENILSGEDDDSRKECRGDSDEVMRPRTSLLTRIKQLKHECAFVAEKNQALKHDLSELKKVVVIAKRVSTNVYDSKQMNSFVFQGLTDHQKELVGTIMNLKREHFQLSKTFEHILAKKKLGTGSSHQKSSVPSNE